MAKMVEITSVEVGAEKITIEALAIEDILRKIGRGGTVKYESKGRAASPGMLVPRMG